MTNQIAASAPVLHLGDSGEWVLYLKQLLEHNGISPGKINDSFDAATQAAVKQFQQRYAVDTDDKPGTVGLVTWQNLIGRADAMEDIDESRGGTVMGQDKLAKVEKGEDNLDPGEQVGRKGWVRTDVHVSVHDCYGVPVAEAQAFARFVDRNTEDASDESGTIHEGRLRFDDVWVPREGWFYLYVSSTQPTPEGYQLGHIEGMADLNCKGGSVVFEARQQEGLTLSLSEAEAQTRGLNRAWSLEYGGSIPWIGGPSFGGTETTEVTDESTRETGRELSYKFPGNGFDLQQQ